MTPYRPVKQTSKRSLPQQSVLPVPDLSDVDALLSKPRFSADAFFDPDPRFQLFEQKSVYDKLSGSYVDQPLGTLYSNALNAELNHTLAEAWRFNPVALSIRAARETACEFARTPGHGLNEEVISWVSSIGLSRVQAQSREKEAGDVAAKKYLLYERYAELHDDPFGLNDTKTFQEELDDFYDPLIGEGGPSNPYELHHHHEIAGPSPPHGPQPVDGTEDDGDLDGFNINTMRSSLPARRGWVGGRPAPVSIANPKCSSVLVDHDYCAASLPTPDSGAIFAPVYPSDGAAVSQDSTMISPPLTGVDFVSISHKYQGLIIPARHVMPSAAPLNMPCSTPNTAISVMQASDQNHINLAPAETPTFEAKLGPLSYRKQAGKKIAIFENNGGAEWLGRREGPYDFGDFCSASLESEHSDLSDGSEPTLDAGDIDGAAHLHTITPDANGMDLSASNNIPVHHANTVETANPYGTAMSDDVTDGFISIAKTLEAPAGAAHQDCNSHIGSLDVAYTRATPSGHITEQTPFAIVEGASNEISTPNGTPEQARNLAQDLEQSIHSAVSQTASLAQVLGKSTPPVLLEPVVAISTAHGLQRHSDCLVDLGQPTNRELQTELIPEHDGNKYPRTQSTIGPMQTQGVCHEPHQLNSHEFTTPVPQRVQNIQSASLTKPRAFNLTPEYNSTSEEDDGASLDSPNAGVFASPTNRTQGGQNALSHYVQETSSRLSLAACDGSMSISNAGSSSPEPEDMALTPTNMEFRPDDLTPSDPLEEVSLVEDSSRITSFATLNGLQQSHMINFTSAYSPYLNASVPTSSSCYATPAPALITPNNNTSPNHHMYTPFQVFTPSRGHTLVLPSTTPGTPTPAPKGSDQHHSKISSSAMLRHKNAIIDRKMRKSVKSVFQSKKLGSRSPSPGQKAASDGGDGDLGIKFIKENGQAMKRTHSEPAKATPAHAAPLTSMERTRSQDNASSAATMGMARTKSQDQVAHAVIVPGKRRFNTKTDGRLMEDPVEGVDGGQVRKRLRRSIRTSQPVVVEGV